MSKKEKRFERTYKQRGAVTAMEIWVDKETGVNYLSWQVAYGGGVTPLLDKDGKVVVTPIDEKQENNQ